MKVSVILPVFNEEKRVKKLAKTLSKINFLDEIIFVDDGSKDKSFEILKKFENKKIKVFRLKENKGKGFALGTGLRLAKGEIVVFLDSDLIGLKKEHLKELIFPLIKKKAKLTIGIPLEKKRKIIRPWEVYLSGERAYFRKDLLPHLKKFFELRYGVEFFLNSLFEDGIEVVPLVGLISPSKFEKRSFSEAIKEYFKEIKEIVEDLKILNFKPLLAKGILKSYIKEIGKNFYSHPFPFK